jgi:hypothetical protein
MLLRNGKIPGELDVSFSPRLQHALSNAKQNKTSGASVLLTPDRRDNDWYGVIDLISLTHSCRFGEYRDL